jgi:mannosyltransferase
MDAASLARLEVVVPNLHRRYSGVTATNRMVAPALARRRPAAWLGSHHPEGIARLNWGDLWRLRALTRRRGQPLVWHARRNDEMIVGLLLRAFGWPLRLVFTSAAQRHHTRFTKALIRRMDAIIATSSASAAYLVRPATVIHHGIDLDTYRPPVDRAAAWHASGLPGQFGIGCFGRVRPQKGTDVFVAALCRLLPRFPQWGAVVVGAITPEHRTFADGLRRDLAAAGLADRVALLGERPIAEVPEWYRRVTIFAFTSRNEGFGLTLLEAMAAGTAVVAARAGAAEVAIEDHVTGRLVPPGDVDALVAALEPWLREPAVAAAFGARAHAKALAGFGIDREAAEIDAVYTRVLGQTPEQISPTLR